MQNKTIKTNRLLAALLDLITVILITSIIVIPIAIIYYNKSGINSFYYLVTEDIIKTYQENGLIDKNLVFKATSSSYVFFLIYIATSILIRFIYYVLIPTFNDGATLWKKVFSLKIVDSSGKKPTLLKLCLRSVMFWLSVITIPGAIILHYSFDAYGVYSQILSGISILIQLVVILVIALGVDGQIFYDKWLNLKIVSTRVYQPPRYYNRGQYNQNHYQGQGQFPNQNHNQYQGQGQPPNQNQNQYQRQSQFPNQNNNQYQGQGQPPNQNWVKLDELDGVYYNDNSNKNNNNNN